MDTVVDPPLFRAFPFNIGLRILAPGGLRPTPEQREGYHRFTQMGDPLADDLIAAFRRLPAGFGRAQFDTAVAEGLSAADNPIPELVALFEQVEARTLELPDNKVAQAVVAGLAATNFVARYPLRLVPGGNFVREVVGRRNIEKLAAQTLKRHRGDRSYRRHDSLGVGSRGIRSAAHANM